MKNNKNPGTIRTLALFVAAVGLLLTGTIGGAIAAPQVRSEYFSGGVEMYDIGVTLLENGEVVSSRNYSTDSDYVWDETRGALLSHLVPDGQEFHIGQTYPEVLAVQNTGSIDEYVRVSIYKYWLDAQGEKLTELSPDLIDLHLTGTGWLLDDGASSTERTVLYYNQILPVGATSLSFADTLTINGQLPYKVSQTTNGNIITTTYDYDGVTFQLEVEVDAVQTHSAEAAIKSAWGRTVNIADGALSLG